MTQHDINFDHFVELFYDKNESLKNFNLSIGFLNRGSQVRNLWGVPNKPHK
tara:strand:- start:219 stop:371 length:153 start_codon:yes stop_codon:yes gene_type:complete